MGEAGGGDLAPVIVSVIENRAKEIGVAALETSSSKLYVQQFVETTRGYACTLWVIAAGKRGIMEMFPASLLLVVGKDEGPRPGSASSALQAIAQQPLPRGWFDDAKGFLAVAKCATAETAPTVAACATANTAYLAFGAAGALLRFMEQERGMALVSGGLEVQLVSPEQYMQMDLATVTALELIKPNQKGAVARKKTAKAPSSLFGLLNSTVTKCGAQLLRANILQPLRHVPTLQLRQDTVAELVANETLLANVVACLAQLPRNLDKVCGNLCLRPSKSGAGTLRCIGAMINSCILLQELLRALPALVEVLEPATGALLRTARDTCGHESLGELAGELAAALEDDVQTARSSFLNRTQQCFAVRAGVNGLLDVARATFCRVSEQVQELADRYREQYRLPQLKVSYSAKKGFVLVLSSQKRGGVRGRRGEEDEFVEEAGADEDECSSGGDGQGTERGRGAGPLPGGGGAASTRRWPSGVKVPPEFSVLSSTDRSVHATTNELNAINARLRDAGNDCLVLTEQVLEGLSERVVASWLPLLHRVVDSVALLDMLAAFATLACTSEGSYVRPALTEGGGPLAVVEGRHPVVERLEADRPYVPNDTYLAFSASFHVITGPNMAGKSTYLRQVALICIMAQVGCFVPAKFVSIPPLDRLLTRIGTGDSLETNSSSFMVEMQETAHILGTATPRSLVLVDELGRATSTIDGLGVAWAVSEHLIASGAGCLFATHFHQLTELAVLYPNCRAWHFDVAASRDRLDYTWKLSSGGGGVGHYGLALARAVGFPEGVMEAAEAVVAALDDRGAARLRTYSTPAHRGEVALWGLAHKLACVAQSFHDGGSQRALQKHLRALKQEAEELLRGPAPPADRLTEL